MKKLFILTLAMAVLVGCTKEEESSESLPAEPSISFVSLSVDDLIEFDNSVTLSIAYKDNNGDIGFVDPDEFALEVKDSRLEEADLYHVTPLAPLGTSVIIQGQLNVILNNMFILGNGNQEIVTLSIRLRDRANNWSNIITTPPITINRQ